MTPISPDAIEAVVNRPCPGQNPSEHQIKIWLSGAEPHMRRQWQAEAVERVEGLKRDRMELSEKRAYDRAIDDSITAIKEAK